MLVEPDKSRLGDCRLSPAEALKKSFEDTEKRVEKYRLADQDDLANEEKRMGHPMKSNDLITRVTKLNRHVWAEDSLANPDTVAGFYTEGEEDGERKKVFICAFEKGWLPEFSIVMEDAAGLPVKERRGWRTVLIRLLHAGHLTFSQIVEGFGDAMGINARNWNSLTQGYR